jgi:hypothetical protein
MNHPVFPMLQIFQRLRDAMARQVGGTGRVDHAQLAERAGNQRLVPNRSKPQDAVKPLLNQVDLPIRAGNFQLQPGIGRHESRQGRHERGARQLARQIDPQTPAKRRAIACEHRVQIVNVSEQIAGSAGEAPHVRDRDENEEGFETLHLRALLASWHCSPQTEQ